MQQDIHTVFHSILTVHRSPMRYRNRQGVAGGGESGGEKRKLSGAYTCAHSAESCEGVINALASTH